MEIDGSYLAVGRCTWGGSEDEGLGENESICIF